jgi:hypothetical protein
MKNEQWEQLWRRRLAEQADSGLSVAQWCRNQGMRTDRFYFWRRRLNADLAQHETKTQPATFLPVHIHEPAPAAPAAAGVSLRLGAATIEVQPGFDPATLRALLQVLETNRC